MDSYLIFLSFSFLISQTGIKPGSQHGGEGPKNWQRTVLMGQNYFPPPDSACPYLRRALSTTFKLGSPQVGRNLPEFRRWPCFQQPLTYKSAHTGNRVLPAPCAGLLHIERERRAKSTPAHQVCCDVVSSPCPRSYKSSR